MIAPCYLVHGGEPLQTEEIICSIRDLVNKAGYTNYVVCEINAQFDWEQLLNKCQNLDLFAQKTLMELRLQGDTVSKQAAESLEKVLQKQDSDTCILIRANKLKPQTYNSSWFQTIQKRGEIRLAKPIVSAKWPSWLQQRLKQANFNPSPDALEYMAKLYEGNLNAAVQCINRLQAVLPAGSLGLEQIKPFLDQSSQYSVFDLTAASIKGDLERTFRIFQSLRDEGVDPLLMLWGLTREVRNLLRLKGDSYVSPDLKVALDRLPAAKLNQILRQAKTIDLMAKGIQNGDVWQPLLAAFLALAGSKTLIMEELTI